MGRQHVCLHLPVFILLSLAVQVVVPQLQYSSRSYQHAFSRAPTPGFRYDAGRVIRDAVRIAEAEEKLMKQRVTRGVDKKLEDYEDVEPILFIEISEIEPRVAYNCRVINWIARLARQRRIPDPLPRLLGHPEAKQLGVTCPFTPPDCSHFSTYRTIDGMCNNPSTSHLGGAFTPFRREAEPEHETGRSYIAGDTFLREDFPRTTGVLGRPLPSARQVSLRVHQSGSDVNPESTCSFMFTLWGQFLAHDLAERAPRKGYREVPIECCDQTVKSPAGVCFNIDIQRTDFFRQFGRRCLAFARSAEATDFHCSTGKREVLNQASSFLDGGSVYGVTLSKIRRLRKFEGGLMETSVPNNLPMSPHPNVKAAAQGFSLFLAGDDRANEFTGLVGLETIWVREHNRIAQILSDYNPRWDDHRLFLETRRIIISMLQHITYNEYLPKLIPKELHHKYDLVLEKYGNYHGYNRRVDPRVTNLFATAAFRFGHSMMRSTFNLMKEDYRQGRSPALNLKHMFFTSNGYTQTEHSFMRGMTSDASEKCDRIVTSDFIDHLYETKHGNGFDLAAFNIQRGRDHGLPGYNFWRKHYGLPVASAFSTNKRTGFVDHDYDAVNRLKSVYDHPDDVDVWTGGISELTGGRENVLGPLFANIIANQFRALRQGDRFWYENSFPGSLSLDQLSEIRKVTLARVLCNHIDFVTIQQEVFTIPTEPGNGRVSCGTFPDIDLRPWREY